MAKWSYKQTHGDNGVLACNGAEKFAVVFIGGYDANTMRTLATRLNVAHAPKDAEYIGDYAYIADVLAWDCDTCGVSHFITL